MDINQNSKTRSSKMCIYMAISIKNLNHIKNSYPMEQNSPIAAQYQVLLISTQFANLENLQANKAEGQSTQALVTTIWESKSHFKLKTGNSLMSQSIRLYYINQARTHNVASVRKKASFDVLNVSQSIIVEHNVKGTIGNHINNFVNDEKTYYNYHYVKGIVL